MQKGVAQAIGAAFIATPALISGRMLRMLLSRTQTHPPTPLLDRFLSRRLTGTVGSGHTSEDAATVPHCVQCAPRISPGDRVFRVFQRVGGATPSNG